MIPIPTLAPVYRIVIAVLVVVVGVQAIALTVARATRDTAIAQRAQVLKENDRLVEASQNHDRAVSGLRAANEALVIAIGEKQTAIEEAVKGLSDASRVIDAQSRELRKREAADRAKPQCQLVLNTRLDPCPALADGVRERSERRLPRQTG